MPAQGQPAAHRALWMRQSNLYWVPLVLGLVTQRGEASLAVARQLPSSEGFPVVVGITPEAPTLDVAVLRRAQEEVAVARSAEAESEKSSKAMVVNQQELLANMARKTATEAFKPSEPAVPEAKALVTETRRLFLEAQDHLNHIKKIAAEARNIPAVAAQQAQQAIQVKVKQEADAAATSSAVSPEEAKELRAKRTTAVVGDAVEPYHLALLRAQKGAAETYAKAKSAIATAQKLSDKAHKIAENAQALQAKGFGMQAQQQLMVAHSTMQQAANMKQWAWKLYKQANDLNNSLGHYQLSESIAATRAAMTLPTIWRPTFPSLDEN